MPRTIAENRLPTHVAACSESIFSACEKRAARLWIGVKRSARAVANGVAVVQLVEQIVYGDPPREPVHGLRELEVNDSVRRHEAGKTIGLVVVVVLRADVTRNSAELGFRSEPPRGSRVRFYARNQGYDVAADVDAADGAVTETRVGQGNVREQRDCGGNRG